MTDKQLRSLTKTQLFELLHQQEIEIERLAAENKKLSKQKFYLEQVGSLAEASVTVSGIIDAAQTAADVYLESIRNVEAEKLEAIVRLEEEAKVRAVKDAEARSAELMARVERLVMDMLRAFDSHVSSMGEMKEELTLLINKNDLRHLIPGNPTVSSK